MVGGGQGLELVHFEARTIQSNESSSLLFLLTWCLDANFPDMSSHRGK